MRYTFQKELLNSVALAMSTEFALDTILNWFLGQMSD